MNEKLGLLALAAVVVFVIARQSAALTPEQQAAAKAKHRAL